MKHGEFSGHCGGVTSCIRAAIIFTLPLAVPNFASAVASVTVSPTSLSFGSQISGSPTQPQVLDLTNSGTATVSIASVVVTGGEADDFLQSNNCGSSLAAGATCNISVVFFPVSTGSKTATLAISNTASGSPQRVALTGTGTAVAGELELYPANYLGFGTVALGSGPFSENIAVSNGGNSAVAFTSIELTGGQADNFSQSSNCGISLAPGASCSIAVSFLPVSAGTKSAALAITDSASDSPQRVVLFGTGVKSPTLALGVSTLNFADQFAGTTSSAQSVSLFNGSIIPLTFGAISVTGGQADDFSESNNCGTTLASYASCSVSVTFKPVSPGFKAATLLVTGNGVGSPQHVALTGLAQQLPAIGLNSIFPSTVVSRGSGFTLNALGQGFATNAVILLNGSALSTTYVSEAQVQAAVPASEIASAGAVAVTVENSAASGAASAPLMLKVNAAAPDAVAFQITAGHSGAVSFDTLALPSMSAWSVDVGGPPSYAIIAEGKVVVTVPVGDGTHLLALDQHTGSILWGPVEIGGAANAAYDGGKISVVSTLGFMQSFDLGTGHSDWISQLVGKLDFTTGPTALNGIAFTGGAGGGGLLYAVSGATGAILWTQPVQDGDFSAPAVTDQGVYVTYPCWIYAFQL